MGETPSHEDCFYNFDSNKAGGWGLVTVTTINTCSICTLTPLTVSA